MDEVTPTKLVKSDLEERLILAQAINKILHSSSIIKWKAKEKNAFYAEKIESYLHDQLRNLLLAIMGERSNDKFNEEEVAILKAFINKIKKSQEKNDETIGH
jgi:hypothetical protein